jgi:hypothetical protein
MSVCWSVCLAAATRVAPGDAAAAQGHRRHAGPAPRAGAAAGCTRMKWPAMIRTVLVILVGHGPSAGEPCWCTPCTPIDGSLLLAAWQAQCPPTICNCCLPVSVGVGCQGEMLPAPVSALVADLDCSCATACRRLLPPLTRAELSDQIVCGVPRVPLARAAAGDSLWL